MDESERQRLQELVDAIHLTAAALIEWEVRSGLPFAQQRFAMFSRWRPMPGPRGWPSIPLGSESKMIVPLVSPYFPQMLPLYPGLSHSGPISGGIPTQGGIPYGPYAVRTGMIPYGYGYGYGLLHAGWEPQGIGGGMPYGSPGIGFSHGGYGPMGMGMGPVPYGMSHSPMMHMGMPGIPLQPAWSMGPGTQPMPGAPHV